MEEVTGKYHVFISHRGPDTKLNIASLINRELKRCGLNVFLDREIRKGDVIFPAIQDAIQSASVHIVIFSKRHAESELCLKELCLILKSSYHCKTIPVFYDVKPGDLRNPDRDPFATAFQNNPVKDKEVVEEWKKALVEASYISGHEFATDKSDYAEFLDDIVKSVWGVVKWDFPDVAKYQSDSTKLSSICRIKFSKNAAQRW